MNKADIVQKFENFEEREDVKEVMRQFTLVLADLYGRQGTTMPHGKFNDVFLEQFEVENIVYDKEDL